MKLLELAQYWDDVPEILILGPNHGLHEWAINGHYLGTDISTESMHKNEREVFVLGEKGQRLFG